MKEDLRGKPDTGSVRYVLDAAGNVQNDYWYDAFGQRIAGHENIPNRLRYNAQIEDDLTGLYYLRARYYNTGIGRFTQEDVIYNDGLNLYAYCSSNPVMYADPSGFAKQCDPKVGGEKDESGNKGGRKTKGDTREYNTRKQAMNAAKDRAGVTHSQQPNRQWVVGDDIYKKGGSYANYEYSSNPTHHGRYYEYDTPNGKVVIVEHTNDGDKHFHAGEVSPAETVNRHNYDFKKTGNDYYPINETHHYYYGE